MKGEIVRTFTEDGIRLDGFVCSPNKERKDTIVLHCHGLAGNFYSNPFIEYIGDAVVKKGLSFLTFNNRGHDCLSESLKVLNGLSSDILIGEIYEAFDDCIHDIKAWINFAEYHGYKKVILQGHSSGASKIAYYQYVENDDRVKGLIFISPPDTIGLQRVEWNDKWEENLELAQKLVSENKNPIMPDGVFHYPISAKSYLSYVGQDSKVDDIFNFYNSNDPFNTIKAIKIPILGILGTEYEAVVNDVYYCMELLKNKAVNSPACDTFVVEGAPHSYLGYEVALTKVISYWLEKLILKNMI